MVNCNLDKEDQQKFDELMKKFIRKSIGKFRKADLVRLCIRFTWENFDKIKQLKSEITRLNEIIIKQQKELNEKNNKIEKALQSLQ
ncbi:MULTISPECIES: hypothetical protein [Bacillus]|uniref:hypothetical protein n=1 Tax=Bacillus TaxID=1386 RepID=UPI000EA04814|nr:MULTISPECIES: hypothetical protein [Bacillus cereus group]MED3315703.1 hypothetical protein [Bacillus wiedmannii]RKI27409.1 hypothetical protein D7V71_03130 [Bacillus thuringiensis]